MSRHDPWRFITDGPGEKDGDVQITYEVLGAWRVRLEANVWAPINGPYRMTISMSDEQDEQGNDLAIDTDGITTEVLRSVPMNDARKRLARMTAARAKDEDKVPQVPVRMEVPRDWAAFAKVYADLVEAGHKQPLQHLVNLTDMSRNTLSARVRRAREMGLLTSPESGSLGRLTDKAMTLLNQGD